MKSENKSTSDYSLFIHHENQQPMRDYHVRQIANSMKRIGFLCSKSITVVMEGKKLRIVDGHHRFNAAKLLGIHVVYCVEDKSVADEIGNLNFSVVKWTAQSFVDMWAAKGLPDFVELNGYVTRGLPLTMASSLLRGEGADSNNHNEALKIGTYTIKTRRCADAIVSLIDSSYHLCPAVKTRTFISAVSLLLFLPDFDIGVLERKIKINPISVVKCVDRNQALELIEEVYNFRSSNKISLRIPAIEASKRRGDVIKKK